MTDPSTDLEHLFRRAVARREAAAAKPAEPAPPADPRDTWRGLLDQINKGNPDR